MSEFGSVLRSLSDRLDLPQPARSRVLIEVAADLADLEAVYAERGSTPEQAREQALERLDLSDEAIRELVRVHGSPLRRGLDRLGERGRRRWERLALAALLLFLLAGTRALLPSRGLLADTGRGLSIVVDRRDSGHPARGLEGIRAVGTGRIRSAAAAPRARCDPRPGKSDGRNGTHAVVVRLAEGCRGGRGLSGSGGDVRPQLADRRLGDGRREFSGGDTAGNSVAGSGRPNRAGRARRGGDAPRRGVRDNRREGRR